MTKEEIAQDKTITKKERIIRLFNAGVDKKEIQTLAKANPGEVYNALKAAGLTKPALVQNPITGNMVSSTPKPILPEPEQEDAPAPIEKATFPEATPYARFVRALKSAKRATTKELMDEFGIQDQQQMWGTAKRGDIFHKDYYMLSSMDRLGHDLRTLKVISKMWAITTTVSQKMVSHEEEGGRASEREYSVNRSVELNIQIHDKKTGEKLGSLSNGNLNFIYGAGFDALPKAAEKIGAYFRSKDPNPPIPAEADVNFSEMVAKFYEKIAQKKIADAWKKEKVPAEKKQEARRKFSEWKKNALKSIKERLRNRDFKRGHPAYWDAEQKLDALEDAVRTLINYPVFYVFEMGYDYDLSFYEAKAYINAQLTAREYAIKEKYPNGKDERYGWKYFHETASEILGDNVNPILGLKPTGSGYTHNGNVAIMNVYPAKTSSGGGSPSAESGILVGKSDIGGREGIPALMPDGRILKVGGGEIILNEKASTDNCHALSKMNVEGGGVAFDCDLQKVANTDRASGKMPKDEWHQESAAGGTQVPARYKNMGFTDVGHMIESTQPEKKWMVLAKKGDQYKVVHGGQKGMEDFSQHKDEARRQRFWKRMGGEDSEYTRDPFSPLYWHKKYGTWAGGWQNAATGIQTNNITKDELRDVLSGKSQDSAGKAIRAIVAHIEGNRRSGKISRRDGESKKEEQRVLIQYINENNLWIEVNLGEFTRGGEEQSVKLDSKYATKLSNAVYYDLWSDYFYSLLLHDFFFPDTKYELIGFYKLQHIILAVVRQPFVRLTAAVNLEDIQKYLANKGFVKTNNNDYKNPNLGISIKDLHERNVLMKDDIPYFIDTHFVIDDKSILPLAEMPASEGRKIHGFLHQENAETGLKASGNPIYKALNLPKYQDLPIRYANWILTLFDDLSKLKKTKEGEYYIELDAIANKRLIDYLEKHGYGYGIGDSFTANDKLFEFTHAVRMFENEKSASAGNKNEDDVAFIIKTLNENPFYSERRLNFISLAPLVDLVIKNHLIHDKTNPIVTRFNESVYFEPSPVHLQREGKRKALVEYATHFITGELQEGSKKKRAFDKSKFDALEFLIPVLKSPDVQRLHQNADPSKNRHEAIVYAKEILVGNGLCVILVAEMSKSGIVRAVTFLPKNKCGYIQKQKAANVWLDAPVIFSPSTEQPPAGGSQIEKAGGGIIPDSTSKDTKKTTPITLNLYNADNQIVAVYREGENSVDELYSEYFASEGRKIHGFDKAQPRSREYTLLVIRLNRPTEDLLSLEHDVTEYHAAGNITDADKAWLMLQIKTKQQAHAEAGQKTKTMENVIFTVDSEELDQLLMANHRREIDYKEIKGDSYYVLNRKDYDRFVDYAISSGFDTDTLIDEVDENGNYIENEMRRASKGTKTKTMENKNKIKAIEDAWDEYRAGANGDKEFEEWLTSNPVGHVHLSKIAKAIEADKKATGNESWTDPAGGTHSANDDDPASDYAAGGKRIKADDLIGVDTLSKGRDGIYTARKGFYYTHGGSSQKFADEIQKQLPDAVIIDKGEVWKGFKGGASVAAQSHFWVKFKMKNEGGVEPLNQHIPLETIDVTGKSVGEVRRLLFDQPKYNDDQVVIVHGVAADYESTLRGVRRDLFQVDDQGASARMKTIDIINNVRAYASGTKTSRDILEDAGRPRRSTEDFELGTPVVYHSKRYDGVQEEESGEVVTRDRMKTISLYPNKNYSGRDPIVLKFNRINWNNVETFAEATKRNGKKFKLTEDFIVYHSPMAAASGTKTPPPMNLYYLKPGNIINEPKYNYHYKITRFDAQSVFFVPASDLIKSEKEQSLIFDLFMSTMDAKTINIEGCPYENERDKVLLQTEISGIINEAQGKELEVMLQDTALRAAQAEDNLGEVKGEAEAHKKAADDTIAGMEAMAGGGNAPTIVWMEHEGDLIAKGISNEDGFANHYVIYKNGKTFILKINNKNKIKGTLAICKAAAQEEEKKVKIDAAASGSKIKKSDFKLSEATRLIKLAEDGDSVTAINELKSYRDLYGDELREHGNIKKFGKPLSEIVNEYERAIEYINTNVGKIPNNYEGKLAGDIWDAWTIKQRMNFQDDHKEALLKAEPFATDDIYIDLPLSVQKVIREHVAAGQYAGGGNAAKGAKAKEVYSVEYSKANETWQVLKNGNYLVTDFAVEENAVKEKNRLQALADIKEMDAKQSDSKDVKKRTARAMRMWNKELSAAKGAKAKHSTLFVDEDGKTRVTHKEQKLPIKKGQVVTDEDGKQRVVDKVGSVAAGGEMEKGGKIKISPSQQKEIEALPSGWGSDLANLCANTSEKEQREIMRKIGLTAVEARKTHPTELKAEPYGALFYIELKRRREGYGGSASSGTQIKKLTRKGKVWSALVRAPKAPTTTTKAPEWARTIANTVQPGAKITMVKGGTEFYVRKIKFPAKGKGEAQLIADLIVNQIHKK